MYAEDKTLSCALKILEVVSPFDMVIGEHIDSCNIASYEGRIMHWSKAKTCNSAKNIPTSHVLQVKRAQQNHN
jgi:hypothetical protein